MKLFELAWGWYEDYDPHLFYGPDSVTPDDWRRICTESVQAAARNQLAGGTLDWEGKKRRPDDWIGWQSLVNEAVFMLLARGFTKAEPVAMKCWGSTIIQRDHDWQSSPDANYAVKLDPEVAAGIVTKNRKMHEEMMAEVNLENE